MDLLSPKVKFVRTKECQYASQWIKERLTSSSPQGPQLPDKPLWPVTLKNEKSSIVNTDTKESIYRLTGITQTSHQHIKTNRKRSEGPVNEANLNRVGCHQANHAVGRDMEKRCQPKLEATKDRSPSDCLGRVSLTEGPPQLLPQLHHREKKSDRTPHPFSIYIGVATQVTQTY